MLSYSTRRIVSWSVEKKNSLVLVANVADGAIDEVTFLLKNPEGLEAALAEAAMASCVAPRSNSPNIS